MKTIKSYFNRVKRVIEFLPVIWKGFDFDYIYSIELFKYQLTRTAKFLESERAVCVYSKQTSMRIRIITELMEKVYDSYYELEHYSQMEEKWGTSRLVYEPFTSETIKFTGIVWSKANTEQEQIEANKEYDILSKKALAKHLKAKKLLWKLIEHNIENFWD